MKIFLFVLIGVHLFYFSQQEKEKKPTKEKTKSKKEDGEVKELLNILEETWTNFSWVDDEDRAECDEVYPKLFLGDELSPETKAFIVDQNVSHVINLAEEEQWQIIEADKEYYSNISINYLSVALESSDKIDITSHFAEAIDFIDEGIKGDGKVLILGYGGNSRSSTVAIAYLMIKENIHVKKALKMIKTLRWIRPSDGFLKQLAQLEKRLRPPGTASPVSDQKPKKKGQKT